MFMTLDELRAMARAKYAPKICRWLSKNGIAYRLDDAGKPVVLRSAVEEAFDPKPAAPKSAWRPDYSKLEDSNGKAKNQGR